MYQRNQRAKLAGIVPEAFASCVSMDSLNDLRYPFFAMLAISHYSTSGTHITCPGLITGVIPLTSCSSHTTALMSRLPLRVLAILQSVSPPCTVYLTYRLAEYAACLGECIYITNMSTIYARASMAAKRLSFFYGSGACPLRCLLR